MKKDKEKDDPKVEKEEKESPPVIEQANSETSGTDYVPVKK
jgi:hypothetical protein